MSPAARTALVNVGTNRQGATATGSPEAMHELAKLGLVGPLGGLTRAGTIERQLIMEDMMEDLFS